MCCIFIALQSVYINVMCCIQLIIGCISKKINISTDRVFKRHNAIYIQVSETCVWL